MAGWNQYEYKLIEACKQVLCEAGYEWDKVMCSKSRKRDIVELRHCIFAIFLSHSRATQDKNARLLGGMFDRVTVIQGANKVRDLAKYDAVFREQFAQLENSFNEKIKDL